MGTSRQYEQYMGYGVSEGAHRIKRQTISCVGANILRSEASVLEWTYRTENKTKTGRGKTIRETECDAYGENLVKATLPGARWTLRHDTINLQVHRVARKTGLVSTMEVEDYFLRKLQESAIQPDNARLLLGKQLK